MLSEKEQKLLDYITTRKENITAELIEVELGKEYLGAIGRLIQQELIYAEKKRIDEFNPLNKYGYKYTKCYMIKEKKKKKDV